MLNVQGSLVPTEYLQAILFFSGIEIWITFRLLALFLNSFVCCLTGISADSLTPRNTSKALLSLVDLGQDGECDGISARYHEFIYRRCLEIKLC